LTPLRRVDQPASASISASSFRAATRLIHATATTTTTKKTPMQSDDLSLL